MKQDGEVRIYTRVIVWKRYELSNHLGNVLATITDRKVIRGGDYSGPKKKEKGGQGGPLDDLNLELAITGAFFEPDVATADDGRASFCRKQKTTHSCIKTKKTIVTGKEGCY